MGLRVLRVRQINVVVALALALVVTFILITPDPTDDVEAILHLVKGAHSYAVGFVSTMNTAPIMRVSGRLYVPSASNKTAHAPELLCTYRC